MSKRVEACGCPSQQNLHACGCTGDTQRVARTHGRAFAQCSHEPRAPAWLVTGAAGLVHASLFGVALYLSSAPAPSLASKPSAQALLEVELAPPPAPPQEKAPEPPPERPEPIKLKVAKIAPPPTPPSATPPEPAKEPEPTPPPAAAAASAALTQNADAPNPSSDTLVTGTGASAPGGMTAQAGSATRAVHAPTAQPAGVPEGTGSAPVDRSRAPRLAAGTDWNCPFPEEAIEDGIDRATVGLEVEVSGSGAVLAISIHQDPGSGFGREARACALKKHWLPALDKSGQPIQQKHRLNVTFVQK